MGGDSRRARAEGGLEGFARSAGQRRFGALSARIARGRSGGRESRRCIRRSFRRPEEIFGGLLLAFSKPRVARALLRHRRRDGCGDHRVVRVAGRVRIARAPGERLRSGAGKRSRHLYGRVRVVRDEWRRRRRRGRGSSFARGAPSGSRAVDAAGNIAAWETEMWLPGGPPGERALAGPELAGMKQGHGQGAGLMTMNADPPYRAAHVRVVAHNLRETPLRLSNLRAPGKIANVFAVEGFTDELAAAARVDAVEYRRRSLDDPRALAVLDRAASMIGWRARPSPNPDAAQGNFRVGRGIAYLRYKQAENYCALAMEVAVERSTGRITVRRIACAHDCGLIMNPDGLRNQV